MSAGELLPGTPGSLALRKGTGHAYWYRVFYPVPGKTEEKFVCNEKDTEQLESIRQQMAYHEWAAKQVSNLRKLGFQVADRVTGDRGRKQDCWAEYEANISAATRVDAMENPPEELEESDWVLARYQRL